MPPLTVALAVAGHVARAATAIVVVMVVVVMVVVVSCGWYVEAVHCQAVGSHASGGACDEAAVECNVADLRT